MRTRTLISMGVFAIILSAASSIAPAHWSIEDGHKMHDAQLPNRNGWDICLIDQTLADDFVCSESGPITDIHFWVSWRGDLEDFKSTTWEIAIYADNEGAPGKSLWTWNRDDGQVSIKSGLRGDQGWHCPKDNVTKFDDHANYYQVNITEIQHAFNQTKGRTYWLAVSAKCTNERAEVGWKTSLSKYGSEAIWKTRESDWKTVGSATYDLAFVITGQTEPFTEIDQYDFGLNRIRIITPWGIETVNVAGNVTQAVYFEGPTEGDATDDDGDSLDEVATEIMELNLTGYSPALGQVVVRKNPDFASLGEIEEQVDNYTGELDVDPFHPGDADMFFDVYYEIELPTTGQTFRTVDPARVSRVIDHKPPTSGQLYVPHVDLQLYDEAYNPTNMFLCLGDHPTGPFTEIDQYDFGLDRIRLITPFGTETVDVAGDVTQAVYFEGPAEGDADDDDGDSLDEVETQILELNLTGVSPAFGTVIVRQSTLLASFGEIVEQVDNHTGRLDVDPFHPGDADMFFDVYFQVELVALGQTLYAIDPARMSRVIDHKPPTSGELYVSHVDLELYDEYGVPTGIILCLGEHPTGPFTEIDQYDFGLDRIRLITPSGTVAVDVAGDVTQAVYFEGSTEGDASDDDGDSLDEVATEILELDLTGYSPELGPVLVAQNPDFASLGGIEEQVDNNPGRLDVDPFHPGDADMFLDVYFQIELVTSGQTLRTLNPARVSRVIDHKPPSSGQLYVPHVDLELYDEAYNQTNMFLCLGEHPSGNAIETDTYDFGLDKIRIITPSGTETVNVAGDVTQKVYFEGPDEGDAADDDGNLLDEVETQIVELNLTGVSPSLGTVVVRQSPLLASLGRIEEQVDNHTGELDVDPFHPGDADMFFDVFFEIDMPTTGQMFYTVSPAHISRVIDHKPPTSGQFDIPHVDLELYDKNGRPTPYILCLGQHSSTPFVETDVYKSAWAEIVFMTVLGVSDIVEMTGPTTILTYFEDVSEGDADDDDGNRLDEVPTKMVDLDLRGAGEIVGPIRLVLRKGATSTGLMEEKKNMTEGLLDVPPFAETGALDSFFDLYVELHADDEKLYADGPLHLEGVISHKPSRSGEIYQGLGSVALLDAAGHPTGMRLWIRRLKLSPCIRCGNLDGTGVTDMLDVDEFADNWLWSASGVDMYNPADMDCSGNVDSADLARLAFTWLGTCK